MYIQSLAHTDFETLFSAFTCAFSDYELQLNRKELYAMLKRRGFKPEISFAAFDKNRIVSFTLNGIGEYNGIPTAYDTGTGTVKEYRGKGLATEIFEYGVPILQEVGLKQYLLEVLQHNTKAVSVYRKIGFKTIREFNYYNQKVKAIKKENNSLDCFYSIKEFNIEKYNTLTDFWNFIPSWQNSMESIKRSMENFVCLGVFNENKLIGYMIFEPASGDITQLAVYKPYRRKRIASILLNQIFRLSKQDTVKIINTDTNCKSINAFLQAKNIPVKGKQYEMCRKL